jgi:hypothetical protein
MSLSKTEVQGLRIVGSFLSFAWLLGSCSVASAATFSDGTIDLSNYTVSTFNSSPGVISLSTSQCTSCGNPGTALDINYTFNPTSPASFLTLVGLRNDSWVWNPASQGAIGSVDFGIDKLIQANPALSGTATSSIILLLFQNNADYAAFLFPTLQTNVWNSIDAPFTHGLLPSNFDLVNFTTGIRDNTQHPDFSASAAPITFGFAVRLNDSPGFTSYEIMEDNVSIQVNGVPEPATLGLTLVALGLFASLRARTRMRKLPSTR